MPAPNSRASSRSATSCPARPGRGRCSRKPISRRSAACNWQAAPTRAISRRRSRSRGEPVSAARLLLIASFLGAASSGAHAETTYNEAVVQVVLNGQADSQSFIVRRSSEGHLLLREDDLKTLRLKSGVAALIDIDGSRYVDLATEPRFDLTFDEEQQRATITAAPEVFDATRR